MFKKRQATESPIHNSFTTIIGKTANFEGKLKVDDTIRVDGRIQGELSVNGDAFIGTTGAIMGNVNTTNITVAGEVKGNIFASEQLRITDTGKVLGDITVASFIVDENAFFEGKCTMKHDSNNKNHGLEKKMAD